MKEIITWIDENGIEVDTENIIYSFLKKCTFDKITTEQKIGNYYKSKTYKKVITYEQQCIITACDTIKNNSNTFINGFCEPCFRKRYGIKCLVKDCENYKHQGTFVGDFCSPCYEFYVNPYNKSSWHSQAYRNSHKFFIDNLIEKRLNKTGFNKYF